MSRGFVKEGDQEEIPMVLPRAFLPSGTPNYVTPEGLKLLNEEMESLKQERLDAGNSYVAKNYVEAKMRLLSERINTAVLIDPTKANSDVVSFGMYVKYNDKTIRIVGVDEADAFKGLISFISPIAKALIGKKKGDKFEIKVPRGTEIIEVKEVNSQQTTVNRLSPHVEDKTTNVERQKAKDEGQKTNGKGLKTKDKRQKANGKGLKTNDERLKANDECTQVPQVSQNDSTEFLPIVNERGNIVGRALHLEIHSGNKLLHPAVQLLVYNSNKEIVEEHNWHVAFGETPEKTLKRKISDIALHNTKPKFIKQYIREDKNEKELVSVFMVETRLSRLKK